MPHGLVVLVALVGLQTANMETGRESQMLYTHVRPIEPYLAALVLEGYERSSTFRQLVDSIQQSNVTVWVRPGICAGGRIRSCLVSVSGSERARYVWITIDPNHTIEHRLIAAVAHELQHAVEVAEHPEVTDASATVKLYRQLAFGRCRDGLSEECETMR